MPRPGAMPRVRGLWDALSMLARPSGPAFTVVDGDDDVPSPRDQDEFARGTLATMRLRPRYASLADEEYDGVDAHCVAGPGASVIDLRRYLDGRRG